MSIIEALRPFSSVSGYTVKELRQMPSNCLIRIECSAAELLAAKECFPLLDLPQLSIDNWEIYELQDKWHSSMKTHHRWIIEEDGGKYRVHEWSNDGVAPQHEYPTRRLAAARLLQLLGLGPVAPQDHPEEVEVTNITEDATHD